MLVLGVNKISNWCQITTGSGTYTCRTKEIDGVLCFIFKKTWHPVAKFISKNAEELVQVGDKIISQPFTK